MGGDMGNPSGLVVQTLQGVFAVRLELWNDDCLADLSKQTARAASRRGLSLAKQWKREHWPNVGYEDLRGAEGFYGATWAWAPATEEEAASADVLELDSPRTNPKPKRGQELSIILDEEPSDNSFDTGIIWATLSAAQANELLAEYDFLDEDDFFIGRKGVIFVMDLRVDPSLQGQGKGSELLLEAIDDIDDEVWLIAANDFRSPVPFYKKHGFKVVWRNRHDHALMVRRRQ
jgi:GNAT superfamily N-acetyltransferase